MRKFQVGDTAIGRNYFTLPDRNGMACTITAPLQMVTAFEVGRGTYTTKLRYRVTWADGLESFCQPHTLRAGRARDERWKNAGREAQACIAHVVQTSRGGLYA